MFEVFALFMLFFWFFFFAIFIALFVFWILMIVDVAKKEFPNKDDKLIWVLVIVLAGVIGAAVYFFVGRKNGFIPEDKLINNNENNMKKK